MISRRYNTRGRRPSPHAAVVPWRRRGRRPPLTPWGSLELNQPGAVWSSKLEEKEQNDFDLLQMKKMAFQRVGPS